MEIPEGRSWYFPGQGWLGLALRDEEREGGRGRGMTKWEKKGRRAREFQMEQNIS